MPAASTRRPRGVRQGGGAGRYRGCLCRPRHRGRSSSARRPAPPGSGETCPGPQARGGTPGGGGRGS